MQVAIPGGHDELGFQLQLLVVSCLVAQSVRFSVATAVNLAAIDLA